MPDVVNQLLATEVALDKLGARGISSAEAEQAIWNRHVVIQESPRPSEAPPARGSQASDWMQRRRPVPHAGDRGDH
ncbi:MAG TPA: hypothetical protein VG053_07285 [Solirubrobacteraceae bacterium]|jgi:hypothetical protein|nr:hypothetical protein [Solirubrobacteraceae bacterium]